jgi:hypothetical protein
MILDQAIFAAFIILGLGANLFYDPQKARVWVLKRLSNTPLEKMNKAMRLGLEIVLMVPSYLTWMLRFGIAGLIFFKAYDLIGFEKTLLIVMLVIYVTMTESNKKI